MIELLDHEQVAKIIGDKVLSITAIEGCCGYAFKTELVATSSEDQIEVEGLKFSVSEETKKIAPKLSVGIKNDLPVSLEVRNLAAKSYCGCGRSFTV